MGSIFIIQGILVYIYAFDHNPPHIHVKSGDGEFTITIKDRIVEGKCGVIHFDKKGNVISSWDRETNRVEF